MGFNSGFKGLKIILTFYDYSALVSIDNLANRNWNVKLAEESGHSIIWGWFTLLPCEEGLRKITTSFSWYWEFRDRDWSPRTPERETWIWSYIVWHLELQCLTFGATLSDIWLTVHCELLQTVKLSETAASFDKRVAHIFGKNSKINDLSMIS